MGLKHVAAGKDLPDDINVVIEIPSHSSPTKYEVDKVSGAVSVDRFLETAMHYPCEYGYIPRTLSEDGDPVDVLVISPYSLYPGVVIRCRPIGMLRMTDESGKDTKVLAVPITKLTPRYADIHGPLDLGEFILNTIEHFFTHYKDLEKGKWVKVEGWDNAEAAKKEIMSGVVKYNEEHKAEEGVISEQEADLKASEFMEKILKSNKSEK